MKIRQIMKAGFILRTEMQVGSRCDIEVLRCIRETMLDQQKTMYRTWHDPKPKTPQDKYHDYDLHMY